MTWYDPDEIKAEADGLQRQPEFDPPAGDDSVIGEDEELFASEVRDGFQRIADIVTAVILPNQ